MSDDLEKYELSRVELRDIMTESITEAFRAMGVEVNEPIEMQRDFVHLRRWRKAVDSAQTATFRTVMATLAAGALGALWLGITTMLGKH